MSINFVCAPRLSLGDLRRIMVKQCVLLVVSTSTCALTGSIILRARSPSVMAASPLRAIQSGSVSLCQGELERLERRVSLLRSAAASRAEPSRVIAAVSESIPEGVWIVSLRIRAHRVEIEGRALTEEDMRAFVNRLERGIVDHVAVVSSAMSSRDVGSLDFLLVAEHIAAP